MEIHFLSLFFTYRDGYKSFGHSRTQFFYLFLLEIIYNKKLIKSWVMPFVYMTSFVSISPINVLAEINSASLYI